MPRDVFVRDRIPAAVLDDDPGFVAEGFKRYIDNGLLIRRKRRVAPGEVEALARTP